MLFAIKSVSNLQKDNAIKGRINYLHEAETSSSRSVSCIFGVVLHLEREPRKQINADLKMANETRVLINMIVPVAQRRDCGNVGIRQTCLQW